MKTLILVILFVNSANAQNGYFNLGSSTLVKNGLNHSLMMATGAKFNNFSLGITTDLYGIGKSKSYQFAMAALDLRYFLKSSYISIQPGLVGFNRTVHGINTKGSYSLAALLGYQWKIFDISAGYQYTSFKTLGVKSKADQFKAALSFRLEQFL